MKISGRVLKNIHLANLLIVRKYYGITAAQDQKPVKKYLRDSIAQKNKYDNILHFYIQGMIPVTLQKIRCYTEIKITKTGGYFV